MATLSRRALLGTAFGTAIGTAAIAPLPVFAGRKEWIPQKPSARVIVDNDFAGDPDGLGRAGASIADAENGRAIGDRVADQSRNSARDGWQSRRQQRGGRGPWPQKC